jgi:hypothetical protein
MTAAGWLRGVGMAAVAGLAAPAAVAQEWEPAPHSLDGLETLSGPIQPGRPRVLGVFAPGVAEPLHRDLHFGGDVAFRAGGHLGLGVYLGGGLAVVGHPADATPAMPEGTWFAYEGLLTLDWILPLRGARDPLAAGPCLRLGLAPGFVRGEVQLSRSDREDLRDADLDLDNRLWGGVVRLDLALQLPVWQAIAHRVFLEIGATYQWGLGEARLKLRPKSGGTSLREKDRVRLDAVTGFIGIAVRW